MNERSPIVTEAVKGRAEHRLRWAIAAMAAILVLCLMALGGAVWYALDQKDKAALAGLSLAERIATECAKPEAERSPAIVSDPTLCQDARDVVEDSPGTTVTGPQGPPGPQGPAGPGGAPGADGDDGRNGKNGSDGRNGGPGDDGKPGPGGTDGADGTNGTPGQDGGPGPTGPQGPPGPAGPPGADGKDGQDGDSRVPACPNGAEPTWTGNDMAGYSLTCPAAPPGQ